MNLIKYYLPVALTVFINSVALSQWSTNPTINDSVCTTGSFQQNPVATSDGNGGVFITWYDYRNGTSNVDIYAQHFDGSGNPLWAIDGIPICSASGNQFVPQIIPDGAGNAIITWYDERNGTGNFDIYVQKVMSNGTMAWTTNGVPVCSDLASQQFPAICTDNSGGAYISWWDFRNGLGSDLYIQHINTSGVAQWNANGVVVCSITGNQRRQRLIESTTGNVFVVWEDFRNGTTNSDIMIQKFNSSGVAQLATNGAAVCNLSGYQYEPKLVSDGNGGVYMCWHDERSGNYDIYAQRCDQSGNLVFSTNGQLICNANFNQLTTTMVADQLGNAIITWQDSRQISQTDLYAQKIDLNGNRLWATNGVVVSTAGDSQYDPVSIPDGSNGVIITWEDQRNGVDRDIYAQRLDMNGNALWTADGVAISTIGYNQQKPTITSNGTDGAIIAWEDYRGGIGESDVYAQLINGAGTYCSSPAQPISITGSTSTCTGSSETYSVINDANATSYSWTIPAGWSGSSTSNSINVTAGSAGGVISIIANNACGSSQPASLSLNIISTPAQPSPITGNTVVCPGDVVIYSVTNDPTASSYTWTIPSGWSIIGTSNSNSITLSVGGSSGAINVTANNSCGSSSSQTLNVVVSTPPIQPSQIVGNTVVCSGNTNLYSVTNDINALSYTWTLPSGWNGTSTSSSINATAGSSGGIISVTANYFCGTSAPSQLSVTVNSAPAQPSAITGNMSFCADDLNQLYSVTNDPAADTYNWTLPAGWSGTSTTNSITATAASSGGTISVAATNSCGTSAPQNVTITVNSLPVVSYTQTPSLVCLNTSAFALTGASPLGGVYTGDGVSGGMFDPALAGIGLHTIDYLFTDGNGCSAQSSSQITVDDCAGIDEIENRVFEIYPNPASNGFAVFSQNGPIKSITIYASGTRVRTFYPGTEKVQIESHALPPGSYLIECENNTAKRTYKLIIL